MMDKREEAKKPEFFVRGIDENRQAIWIDMSGILEYLSLADQEQVLSWIQEAKMTGQPQPEEALLGRLSPDGRASFLEYKKLAVNGGLPAVKEMYRRETGSEDPAGLRVWLEKRRTSMQG
jgi:O-methyltransferase involved in polyketide biosynthesis